MYAIGNPFGLDRTMTAGIVSAIGRDIQAPNGLGIPDAIQTDAPINHGNSGGPLLDSEGRVVGINDQIDTGGSSDQGNVGVGFAIASNTAQTVVPKLLATGHVDHAWLGLEVAPIDSELARIVRGLPSHGVLVVRSCGEPGRQGRSRRRLEAGDRRRRERARRRRRDPRGRRSADHGPGAARECRPLAPARRRARASR